MGCDFEAISRSGSLCDATMSQLGGDLLPNDGTLRCVLRGNDLVHNGATIEHEHIRQISVEFTAILRRRTRERRGFAREEVVAVVQERTNLATRERVTLIDRDELDLVGRLARSAKLRGTRSSGTTLDQHDHLRPRSFEAVRTLLVGDEIRDRSRGFHFDSGGLGRGDLFR